MNRTVLQRKLHPKLACNRFESKLLNVNFLMNDTSTAAMPDEYHLKRSVKFAVCDYEALWQTIDGRSKRICCLNKLLLRTSLELLA